MCISSAGSAAVICNGVNSNVYGENIWFYCHCFVAFWLVVLYNISVMRCRYVSIRRKVDEGIKQGRV